MNSITRSAAVAVLATASLAAQADTFSVTNEFDVAANLTAGGFSNSGLALASVSSDSFASFNNPNDVLTYSFSLASVSDVTISFWFANNSKNGSATVSWINQLGNLPVTLTSGALGTVSGANTGDIAPSPAGTQVSFAVLGLNAGNYTFAIDADNANDFRVDTFAVNSVTAVPEPETYALMLAGLGALGFMARRRKQG